LLRGCLGPGRPRVRLAKGPGALASRILAGVPLRVARFIDDQSKEENEMTSSSGATGDPEVATITAYEAEQVTRANATGLQPVVFVHGLWLLPSSWDRWAHLFQERGFTALTPGWPDDPETVEQANEHPEVFAGKTIGDIADHFEEIIRGLDKKPVIIGHSFGGLLAQILAGRGLAVASIAVDPAPFRGVLPLPISALKSASPVLGNPANRNRAVPLTFEQFRYAFANAVSEQEAQELYETFAVPGSGRPLFQAAAANLNPWTEAKVDSENPNRGPLLIISGEKDHTVPWAIAHASYKTQQRNPATTEITEMAGRGHALVIDHGWREVADTAFSFAERFVAADGTSYPDTSAPTLA
jgi:non-heme chloroperoxidase